MRGKDLSTIVFVPDHSIGVTRERYEVLIPILIQIDSEYIERGGRCRIGGGNADAATEYS